MNAHAVIIGNGKAVHLANGVQVDEFTLEASATLCGPGPIVNSWVGTIAAQKGTTPRVRITKAPATCKRCTKAVSA
jgi:hypothetical protein